MCNWDVPCADLTAYFRPGSSGPFLDTPGMRAYGPRRNDPRRFRPFPSLVRALPMSNDDKNGRKVADGMSAADRAALSKRASDIGAKIETAKNRHGVPKHGDASQGNAMARGLKISAELIGGVVVGGGIGWLLDKWLGTFPWLFIVFFLLGSAAGILNIVRQAQRETTPPAPSVKDDEDDEK